MSKRVSKEMSKEAGGAHDPKHRGHMMFTVPTKEEVEEWGKERKKGKWGESKKREREIDDDGGSKNVN